MSIKERTMKDEVDIAIYALRYAYSRESFAPKIVSEWIKRIAWFPEEKELLIRILLEERENAKKMNWIDEVNQPYWDNLVLFLQGKQKKE